MKNGTQNAKPQGTLVLVYDVQPDSPAPTVPSTVVGTTLLAKEGETETGPQVGIVITTNDAAVAAIAAGGQEGFDAAVSQAASLLGEFPALVTSIYGRDVHRVAMLEMVRNLGVRL
jgi:hypothetical protein